MILSDNVIKKELSAGNIVISPFDEKYLNPVSVDLTLAPQFKRYVSDVLDVRKPQEVEEFVVPEEGYVLQPGEIYLYAVNERIGVKGNIRAKVEGKSSLGRLGLFIHVTAGFIDPGFEGSLVLELVATRPVKIYPNMKICQIEFARVEGLIEESYDQKAGSKYHGQTGVQESLMHQNFNSGNSTY
jgi:dCTP deaminase